MSSLSDDALFVDDDTVPANAGAGQLAGAGKPNDKGTPTDKPTGTENPTGKPSGAGKPKGTENPTGNPLGEGKPPGLGNPTGKPSGAALGAGKPTGTENPTGKPSGAAKPAGPENPTGNPLGAGTGNPTGKPTGTGKAPATGKPTGADEGQRPGAATQPVSKAEALAMGLGRPEDLSATELLQFFKLVCEPEFSSGFFNARDEMYLRAAASTYLKSLTSDGVLRNMKRMSHPAGTVEKRFVDELKRRGAPGGSLLRQALKYLAVGAGAAATSALLTSAAFGGRHTSPRDYDDQTLPATEDAKLEIDPLDDDEFMFATTAQALVQCDNQQQEKAAEQFVSTLSEGERGGLLKRLVNDVWRMTLRPQTKITNLPDEHPLRELLLNRNSEDGTVGSLYGQWCPPVADPATRAFFSAAE